MMILNHLTKLSYMKVKYVIWVNYGIAEVVNVWALVQRHKDHYHLYFDDCISYDEHALFDPYKRIFYTA